MKLYYKGSIKLSKLKLQLSSGNNTKDDLTKNYIKLTTTASSLFLDFYRPWGFSLTFPLSFTALGWLEVIMAVQTYIGGKMVKGRLSVLGGYIYEEGGRWGWCKHLW